MTQNRELLSAKVVGYINMEDTKVTFPNTKPTYEEYIELVDKVSISNISYMCSSLSTAAGKVNQVLGDRFGIDVMDHYTKLSQIKGRLFHYTGD